jgi:hypothetical protein
MTMGGASGAARDPLAAKKLGAAALTFQVLETRYDGSAGWLVAIGVAPLLGPPDQRRS